MATISLFILIALGLIAIIDIFTKKIPSVALTSLIFIVFFAQITLTGDLMFLGFGVLSFIFAYLLYEFSFIGGIADIKVLTMIGLFLTNIAPFSIMVLLVMIIGIIYKLFFRFGLKYKDNDEIPFIPALWIVYLILYLSPAVSLH